MSLRCQRALAPLVLFLAGPLFAAEGVAVTVASVEDQRVTENRFGGLTIELLLKGGSVAEAKALRVKVKSAKDNVGSVLYKPERDDKQGGFEEFSPDRRPLPGVRLLSPRRDASTVDVTGEIELFIPSLDPNTKQRFDGFLKRLDTPIAGPALKGAKVEITPLSAKEYKARQLKNRPTKEQIMAEGKKQGVPDAEIQKAIELMDALAALGGEEPSPTSILLEAKDPDGRVISIDVVKADGSELRAPSRGFSGGHELKLMKIDLEEKAPADAALLVTLRTPKSLVTIPLNLKEVVLP